MPHGGYPSLEDLLELWPRASSTAMVVPVPQAIFEFSHDAKTPPPGTGIRESLLAEFLSPFSRTENACRAGSGKQRQPHGLRQQSTRKRQHRCCFRTEAIHDLKIGMRHAQHDGSAPSDTAVDAPLACAIAPIDRGGGGQGFLPPGRVRQTTAGRSAPPPTGRRPCGMNQSRSRTSSKRCAPPTRSAMLLIATRTRPSRPQATTSRTKARISNRQKRRRQGQKRKTPRSKKSAKATSGATTATAKTRIATRAAPC
jgi:hypothetical protein